MDHVTITTGIPANEQESSFMNATLQQAGNEHSFSIATHVKVPDHICNQGEAAIRDYLMDILGKAALTDRNLTFEVQLGKNEEVVV